MAFEELEPSDPNHLTETLALHGANLAAAAGSKEVKLDHFRIRKRAAPQPIKRQSANAMKLTLGAIVASHNAAWK